MTKMYIVDFEETTVERLQDMFWGNPQLEIEICGAAHNYTACISDLERAKDADVFLISAYLPDQMGTDLVETLKRRYPSAKFIVALNTITLNLRDRALEKGADRILLKPFRAGVLIHMIEELTAAKRETQSGASASETPEERVEPKAFSGSRKVRF